MLMPIKMAFAIIMKTKPQTTRDTEKMALHAWGGAVSVPGRDVVSVPGRDQDKTRAGAVAGAGTLLMQIRTVYAIIMRLQPKSKGQ